MFWKRACTDSFQRRVVLAAVAGQSSWRNLSRLCFLIHVFNPPTVRKSPAGQIAERGLLLGPNSKHPDVHMSGEERSCGNLSQLLLARG